MTFGIWEPFACSTPCSVRLRPRSTETSQHQWLRIIFVRNFDLRKIYLQFAITVIRHTYQVRPLVHSSQSVVTEITIHHTCRDWARERINEARAELARIWQRTKVARKGSKKVKVEQGEEDLDWNTISHSQLTMPI